MSVDASAFLARMAREAVSGQAALDALARERLERWAEDGVPPSAFSFTQLSVASSGRLRATPRVRAGAPGRLLVSRDGGARIRLALRVHPRDQESLDDEDV